MKAIAEAPGKVIISGEHFVVHGAVALAAAIDRKTRAEASRSDRFALETPLTQPGTRYSESLPVEKLIREMYRDRSKDPAVRVQLSSALPTGSGLGSSASTMVAAVAAVGALEGWDLDARSIVEAAMFGEKLVHGRPSGIDVAISALGGVIQFRVGEEPRKVELPRPQKLLVAYSGTRRSSGKLISKVSSMKDVYPSLFSRLCDSATLISTLATERLLAGTLDELGELMTYNHAVLGMVGASNPKLDSLVDSCLEAGCLGAKLTGAGGGGSVVAIPPKDGESAVMNRLSGQGFASFVTTIPCEGVKFWTSAR